MKITNVREENGEIKLTVKFDVAHPRFLLFMLREYPFKYWPLVFGVWVVLLINKIFGKRTMFDRYEA